ncbi:serine/threonine-protein kinase [Kibdelosporangium persicum]|uniref:Serine/threonine-protein kinase AfsK n=1 Tax=Kibdelosporangium persicum TaxID=2698649 RepID=A0ABX2F0V1_9PSEU|nr:serine/threonine-protein kinase [Kibdelosporangium persicum]NRN64943.1 Serine/threonine-protein kinase AfsK [Kibdelosporangium persicum]
MQPLRSGDPERIGPYRLVASLGQGGMGRVFLGAAPDGRLVAVKQVHPELARDDEFRARFRQEVEVSRRVSGAYTAAIVGADPEADEPWLASVFMTGPSLRQAIDETGPLPEHAVLLLAAGLASALRAIHGSGLVHRDLKPGNVLLTADGPKVIDFGIARALAGGPDLTSTGSVVGSPAFMSPEQAEGRELGPASDIFSFGSMLVAAAAGHGPFSGDSTPQTLYNVVHTAPNLALVPPRIHQLVEPCLSKDPRQRPTAAQVLDQLDTSGAVTWSAPVNGLITRQHEQVRTALAWPARTPPAPQPKPRRRRWTAVLASAMVIVTALLAVTAVHLSDQGDGDRSVPVAAQPVLTVAEALTTDTLRRVDPCALVNDITGVATGSTRDLISGPQRPGDSTATAQGTMCAARNADQVTVFLFVGREMMYSAETTVASDGIVTFNPTPSYCVAMMPLTNRPALGLSAEIREPAEGSCEVARTALREAITRIRTGGFRYNLKPGSLLTKDACTFLDSATVERTAGPITWSGLAELRICGWLATDTVKVQIGPGVPAQDVTTNLGEQIELDGRTVYRKAEPASPGEDLCTVTFRHHTGEEVAVAYRRVSPRSADTCDRATDLARVAFSRT